MSSAPPTRRAGLLRGVSLDGDASVDWARERGLVAAGGGFRLLTDEISEDGFRVARLWHSAVTAEWSCAADETRILLQIDGDVDARLTGEAAERTIRPGGLLVLPAGGGVTLSSSAGVARYEVGIDGLGLPAAVVGRIGRGLVLDDPDPPIRSVVIATANSALEAGFSPDRPGFAGYRLALTHLVRGLLIDLVGAEAAGLTAHEASLLRRAQALIAQHAPEVGFSVGALARALRLSERYLQRIYATAGSSPSASLRQERLRLAREYSERSSADLSPEDVARLSGFPTARALRRVLVREGGG